LFNLPAAIYHTFKQDALPDLVSGMQTYGRSFMIRLPPWDIVFSTHPEDVSHVLQGNFANWEKPGLQKKKKVILLLSLFVTAAFSAAC
jgi:hypothetical protein